MLKNWKKVCQLYQDYWWLTPLTIFVVWRIFLEIVGRTTLAVTTPIINPWPADPHPPIWARWDSGWYSSILSYGYQLRAGLMSNVTFFPLYPLLWKLTWLFTGLPRLVSGVLFANLASAGAVVIFYRWVQVVRDTVTARRALGLLLIFPTSFFLTAAYSESTFILLMATMLLAAEKRCWLVAAIAAALASATRPIGIALWPALFAIWWQTDTHKNWRTGLVLTFLPPLGLLVFSAYLWQVVGDPFAWLHGQAMAGRGYMFPAKLLASYAHNVLRGGELWATHLGELVALGFATLLFPRLWRQSHGQAILALGLLLPPIFTNTLTSFPRFTLVVLPLFTTLAQIKKRWVIWVYSILSIPLLVLGTYCFVTWRWSG